MKHIKIFEKFDSDEITKVMGFLSKKSKIKNGNDFISDIKYISSKYDIPESMFSNIKYMKANAAATISNFEINNQYDVYAVVFWFSVEKGYLSYSDVKSYSLSAKLDKIKSYGYEKGKFIPFKFDDLVDGDIVAMYLSAEPKNIDRFTVGQIYVDGYGEIHILQNSREGGYNDSAWRDRGYKYSWCLGSDMDESDDHCEIYKYIQTEEPIEITSDETESKIGTIPHYYTNGANIKDADFALVMYLDDVLIDIYDDSKTKKEIKSNRKKNKNNALALLSDKQIKNQNIDRYINSIFSKYNITKDESSLSNLNSLIKVLIYGNVVGYYMISNYRSVSNLGDFTAYLHRYLKEGSDQFENFKYIYDRTYREMVSYKEAIENGKNKVKDSIKIKELIVAIESLSDVIINKCDKYEIKTVYDLRHFYQYFYSIYNMLSDRYIGFSLSSACYDLVTDILANRRIDTYYLNYDYSSDIENINRIVERLNKPI